jgi:L-alanine-DL-glutamate epimerase-like enolase superfamily enzyme
MASPHVSLAAVAVESLELQIGESDLSRDLVHGVEPALAGNACAAPRARGWGVDLDEAVLAAHSYRPAPAGLDERLG